MNTRTGEIIDDKELEEFKQKMEELEKETASMSEVEEMKEEMKDFVRVQDKDITRKQRRLKQVSKHDNRSKLGKMFTRARQKR